MNIVPSLTWINFLPLLGAIVVLFIPRDRPDWIRWWSFAVSLVVLVLSAWLWLSYDHAAGGMQFVEDRLWIPIINVHYHVGADGISVPMIFLTGLLTAISILYSFNIQERVKEFFAFFLLLEMGMMGVFTSLDYFLFYVFWEISLVPMYFLIGVWGGERREYAAIKFFLYTLVGSVAMLLAIIAIYFATGAKTFDILEIAKQRPFANMELLRNLAFFGFFLGFAIKVPVWPFHTWLPDAHVEAPTAGSVILAGILLKMGTYGFLRIIMPTFPGACQEFALLIGVLALISIVYGALVAMAQWDLKKLIAYSSVNHLGYVMMGIAAAMAAATNINERAIAVNGAVFQMFNHGIITGSLFLMVGVIYERTHSRDLARYGGLGARVPVYAGVLTMAMFASLGLPGLAGFNSEFLVFRGTFSTWWWIAALATMGLVVGAAYILWTIQRLLLGTAKDEPLYAHLTDMNPREIVSLAPLLFFMVLFGVLPFLILNTINLGSLDLLRMM